MPRYVLVVAPASFALTIMCLAGCSRVSKNDTMGSNVVASPMLTAEAVTALKPILPPQFTDPMSREPSVEETVADALARIGADAVPELVQTLEDPDAEVRMYAARSLSMMGPTAQSAVPALVKHLHDSDDRVRRTSARALGQIGPAAKSAVPELIQLLRDEAKRR